MTCIAGLVENGTVWVGGDALASDGYSGLVMREPKVFVKGTMLFGGAGSGRFIQLLQYTLELPDHPDTMGATAYLAGPFTRAVWAMCDANRYALEQEDVDSNLLIGYQGRLYYGATDLSFAESIYGYDAVGAGAAIAIGSLFSTARRRMSAKNRLVEALEASAAYCLAVSDPFTILHM